MTRPSHPHSTPLLYTFSYSSLYKDKYKSLTKPIITTNHNKPKIKYINVTNINLNLILFI